MHQWSVRCTPAFDLGVIDYNVNRIYSMEQPYSPCGFFRNTGLCGDCTRLENGSTAPKSYEKSAKKSPKVARKPMYINQKICTV